MRTLRSQSSGPQLGKILGLVLALGMLPFVVSADLELALDLVTTITLPPESDTPETQESAKLLVRLSQDEMWIVAGQQGYFYDFRTQRIYRIDRDEGTYIDQSLYGDLGFRDYELQNRKFLGGALDSAGLEDNPIALVLSEHELSVTDRGLIEDIERIESDGMTQFVARGKPLMTVSSSRIKISPEYSKPFTRFIRSQFGGHPSIVGDLATPSGIPERITLFIYNVSVKTVELRLQSVREVRKRAWSLKGLTREWALDDQLQKVVPSLGPELKRDRDDAIARALEQARQATASEDLVGGMLRYLEYSLMTGTQDFPWTEEERNKLIASHEVQALVGAIQNPSNKEKAKVAVDALVALRAKPEIDDYLLKVFEANTRAAAGEPMLARDLMIEALKNNPYLAGAWKDLGDIYFRGYEAQKGWACWDIAREISPGHPLLETVNDYEARLRSKYPGFF